MCGDWIDWADPCVIWWKWLKTFANAASDFRSLSEGAIDTTTASGELIFNIFSALAQFERRLIQERTKAGLAAARARGRKSGRPKTSPKDAKVKLAKSLMADKSFDSR